jgi:hypothetical protein
VFGPGRTSDGGGGRPSRFQGIQIRIVRSLMSALHASLKPGKVRRRPPVEMEAVRHLSGVRGVVNQITVRSRIKPHAVEQGIGDAFQRNALVDARQITVTTEDGTPYCESASTRSRKSAPRPRPLSTPPASSLSTITSRSSRSPHPVAPCGASLACAVVRRGLRQPEHGKLDLAEMARRKRQATALGCRGPAGWRSCARRHPGDCRMAAATDARAGQWRRQPDRCCRGSGRRRVPVRGPLPGRRPGRRHGRRRGRHGRRWPARSGPNWRGCGIAAQ